MPVSIVIGSQWGDEGKGKIVDLLSPEVDVVARYQGGANAGHTIVWENEDGSTEEFVLHLVPSGIFHEGVTCVIGNGVVLDPKAVLEEIEKIESLGIDTAIDFWPVRTDAVEAAIDDEDSSRGLYRFASAWAGWIQARSDDYGALADLPAVELAFRRVLALTPGIDHGNAHVYLGVLLAQRPEALGGQPEAAREHFEQAIAISDGRNLMAKILYAEHYARLVFDRELHDRLVEEVLAAEPEAGELTLSNTLARERARELRASADDFF